MKVKYHKHCRQHEHVKRVKRLVTRALSDCSTIQVTFYHELTGVVYEDAGHLKFLIRNAVRDLANKMTAEWQQNNKDLTCDFSILTYWTYHKWIAALNTILHYIYDNYPEEFKTDVFVFADASAQPEEKKREYVQHYKEHPLLGFNKSFFMVYPDGKKRQLWALTADVNDLKEATQIETRYQ